jgi:hypothetical protein
MIFPLLEYAKSVGRNTADFDANDIAKASKWWDSLHKNHFLKKEFRNMGKIISAKKAQVVIHAPANGSRVGVRPTKQQIQEVVLVDENEELMAEMDDSGEMVEDEQGTEEVEEVEQVEEEIVGTVDFTQRDIDGVVFACQSCLQEFDFTGMEDMAATLQGLLDTFAPQEE